MTFHDHFSGHADEYRRHRPRYPGDLFAFLASVAPATGLAVDCGTGNGQAAVGLARHFARVVATDASLDQLRAAEPTPGVAYAAALAENPPLAAKSADAVTIAQALHWFDRPRFYAAVRRIARPRAVIAAFLYGRARIAPDVDEILGTFYRDVVGPYWPPERALVESEYAALEFPFEAIEAPEFFVEVDWSADGMLGYLDTWSAVRRYRAALGTDPLIVIADDLHRAWGDGPRPVRWRLAVVAGIVR